MKSSIQQSAIMLIDSWKKLIDEEGGKVDIKVDNHLFKFSGDAILRVCFWSNYVEGEQILEKLQHTTIPGIRFLICHSRNEVRLLLLLGFNIEYNLFYLWMNQSFLLFTYGDLKLLNYWIGENVLPIKLRVIIDSDDMTCHCVRKWPRGLIFFFGK